MKLKMDKDLLIKVLSINCAVLLALTLILSVCLIHSCSTNAQSDYEYDRDHDDDDDDDDNKYRDDEIPNGFWVDLEDPSNELQTITFGFYDVSDKIELRVNNHSKYIGAVTTINGKNIATEGGSMNIRSDYYRESGSYYGGRYDLSGTDINNAEFQITPCKQDTLGIYSVTIGDFVMQIELMDCKSILFDRKNGITLKGVTGEWDLQVYPTRGDAIEVAYGECIKVNAISEETSDISFSWLKNGIKIEASEEISSLKAQSYPVEFGFDDEDFVFANENKNSYKIFLEENESDILWESNYSTVIE